MFVIYSDTKDIKKALSRYAGTFDPNNRRFLYNVYRAALSKGNKNYIEKARTIPVSHCEQNLRETHRMKVNRDLVYYRPIWGFYVAPLHYVGDKQTVAGYMIQTENLRFLGRLYSMNETEGTDFGICVPGIIRLDDEAIERIAGWFFGQDSSLAKTEFIRFVKEA